MSSQAALHTATTLQASSAQKLKHRYALRCVYTDYDEIFRTYSGVGYETVRGYDVKLRHYPRHSRIQSLGLPKTTGWKQNCLGLNCVKDIFVNCLRQKSDETSYDSKSD